MNEQDRHLWETGRLLVLVQETHQTPEMIRDRHGNGCHCDNCYPLYEEEMGWR